MIWLILLIACRSTMLSSADVPRNNPSERWAKVLAEVVTDDGYVDYDALEERRDVLDDYVAWLGTPRAFPGRKTADYHATFLNAYNALVMFQVLERGRPDSVLDVRGYIPKPGSGFFLETSFLVGHDYLSLSEIEHERIRLRELDWRDHAAMNCASRSCPPLMPDIYRRRTLNRQLDQQMRQWVNDPERGISVDPDGTIVMSAIVDWFRRDFTFWPNASEPCSVLAAHANEPLRTALYNASASGCSYRTRPYDWSLNHAPGGAPTEARALDQLPDDDPVPFDEEDGEQ